MESRNHLDRLTVHCTFHVTFAADNGLELNSNSTIGGAGSSTGVVNTDIIFTFTLKDRYSNVITATDKTCANLAMSAQLKDTTSTTSPACTYLGSGVFQGVFTTTISGSWIISVSGGTLGGLVVTKTTFIDASTVTAERCTASVDNGNPPRAGEAGTMTLLAKDEYGNVLTDSTDPGVSWAISVTGFTPLDGGDSSTPNFVIGSSAWSQGGVYTASFQSTRSGMFSIDIQVGGVGVTGSPFDVRIESGLLSAAAMLPAGNYTSLVAGSTTPFTLRGKDEYGNSYSQGTIEFVASVLDSAGQSTVSTLSTSKGSGGQGSSSILLTFAGDYLLSLNLTGSGAFTGSPVVGGGHQAITVNADETGLPSGFSFNSPSNASTLSGIAGTPITINIREKDQYSNERTLSGQSFAAILSSGSESVSATLSDGGGGMYAMSAVVTVTGTYTLSIAPAAGGNAIPTEPFSVAVGPAQMSHLGTLREDVGVWTGGAVGRVTEQAKFAIKARDAYANRISTGGLSASLSFTMKSCDPPEASCADASSEPSATHVPHSTEISDVGDGFYGFSYTTTIGGHYFASIKYNGEDIYGSPFDVLVGADVTVTPSSFAFGPGMSSCGAVLVTGELTDITSCAVATSEAETTFGVRLVDAYGNWRITSSMNQDILIFNTTTVSTLFNVNATGPIVAATEKFSVQYEDGVQVVGFSTTVSGRYSTSIIHRYCASTACPSPVFTGGILNTPTFVFVRPAAAYAPNSWATGDGMSLSTAGVASSFIITTRDMFMNTRVGVESAVGQDSGWTLTLLHDENDPFEDTLSGTVVGHANGTYVASFSVTHSGTYRISVKRDGRFIASTSNPLASPDANGPFAMKSYPNRAGIGSYISSGTGSSGKNDGAAVVLVQAMDEYGNIKSRGGDVFNGLVSALPNTTIVQEDFNNGSYAVRFSVTKSGTYQANVYVNGDKSVKGSPVTLTMSPGTFVPWYSEVTKKTLTTAGTPLTFMIQARDMYFNHRAIGGDDFTVKCLNQHVGDYASSAVQDEANDGFYNGMCYITRSGHYTVEVLSPNKEGTMLNISGSPFEAIVEPGVALPEKSGAFGDALTISTAGTWATFSIYARDNYYNPNTGAGTAVFYMMVTGENNRTIPTCPYSNSSAEWGNVTSFPNGVMAGTGSNGMCQSTDIGSGSYRMSFMWTVAGTYRSEIKIDTGSGLTPVQGSIYDLTVKPAVIHAPKSRASGQALTMATAGASMTFVVIARDAYDNVRTSAGGALSVTVLDNSTSSAAVSSAQSLADGNFKVTYTTTRSGSYSVDVRDSAWSEGIANNPSSVLVKPTTSLPANFAVEGGVINDAGVEQEMHFTLVAADDFGNLKTKGGDSVSIGLQGGWIDSTDGTVSATTTLQGVSRDLSTGKYDCSYMSTKSGRFTVTVNVTNPVSLLLQPVPGSPFSIYVSAGPISAIESVSFLREASNATNSSLSLRGLGPGQVHTVVVGGNSTFFILAKDRFGNPRTSGGHLDLWSVNMSFAGPFEEVGLEYEGMDAWMECSVEYTGDAEGGNSGEYRATYPATISGRYIVAVSFNGTRINETEHTVQMHPADAESRLFSSTFPEVTLVTTPAIRFTTAGTPSTFLVYARDRFGNRRTQGGDVLTIDVEGASDTNSWVSFNGTLERPMYNKYSSGLVDTDPECGLACISDMSDGRYMVVLNTTISGKYSVDVKREAAVMGGRRGGPVLEPICSDGCKDQRKNPYNFSTEAAVIFPYFCDASGDGLTAAYAGVVATFSVQARDIFGNKRLVDRYDPVMSKIQGRPIFNGEFPTSSVSFAGSFVDPETCKCEMGKCEGCEALLCGGSYCGNPEPGYPRVKNSHVGLYHFSYLITQSAPYTISVRKRLTVDEERHIMGSPFPLTLTAGPTDPLSCTIKDGTGDGLYRAVAGVNTTVTIEARDFFGNLRKVGGDPIIVVAQHGEKCTTLPDSQDCVQCTEADAECVDAGIEVGQDKPIFVHGLVNDLGNNDYVMSYVITQSGFYSLSLRLNTTSPPLHLGGRTTTRSPFPLQISPDKLDPEQSTVTGEGARLGTIGRESVFYMWPRDRFGNSLAGSTERVDIKLCSTGLVCEASVGAAYVEVRFFDDRTGMWWPVDDKYETITRDADPTRGVPITTDLYAEGDGSTKLAFTLIEGVHPLGDYKIDVRVDGRRIKGAPLNMTVYPVDSNPHPPKSSVTPGPKPVAGKKGTGSLVVRNKYGIKVIEATNKNVNLIPFVSNLSPTEPKVINKGGGNFDIQFQTTRAGMYRYGVQVTNPLGGFLDVADSPLEMQVVPWLFDPSASLASFASGSVQAGQVVDIVLVSRDSYFNELLTHPAEDEYVASLSRTEANGNTIAIPAIVTKNPARGWNARFETVNGTSLTTVSGSYRLDVTNQGVNVVNSPFEFKVVPGPVKEEFCVLNSLDARIMTAGEASPITIQSRDRFHNNRILNDDDFVVVSNSTSGSTGTVATKFEVVSEGVTGVQLTYTIVGTYDIGVTLNGIPVISSPFMATVVPGLASAKRCYNHSLIPRGTIAGRSLWFVIQAVDAFGNLHVTDGAVFDVTLKGFAFLYTFEIDGATRCTGSKCVKVGYVGNGQFNVSFTPTVSGDYLMDTSLVLPDGTREAIAGSPWRRGPFLGTLEILPDVPNMHWSKLGGSGTSLFTSGEDATFTLFARDKFGNPQVFGGANVSAKLVGGFPLTTVPVKVFDECQPPPASQDLCGLYSLSYVYTVAGSYSLSVVMDGVETAPMSVGGLPAEVPDPAATGLPFAPYAPPDCLEQCDDGNCCLVGEGASYGYIGVQNTFMIEARDTYGNKMTKGGEPFTIEVVGQTLGEGSMLDLGTGQYLARYKVLVKGTYTLSVRLRGMHIGKLYDACASYTSLCIKGSPFLDLALSPMGTGLEGIIFTGDLFRENGWFVSSQYTTSIDAKDSMAVRTLEKEPLTAALELIVPGEPTVTVTPGSPTLSTSIDLSAPADTYSLGFRTTKAGAWLLSVMSGDVHCVGSPFSIVVQAGATVHAKTIVQGSGVYGAVVGQSVDIFIQTRDAFDNPRYDRFENVRFGVAKTNELITANNATVKAGTYQGSGDRMGWFRGTYTGPALPNPEFVSLPHVLYVWVSSVPLTPRTITIYRDHSPLEHTRTQIFGEGLKISTAGKAVTFTMETRDQFEILRPDGGASLKVYVTDPNGQQTPYTAVDDNNGFYRFNERIDSAGQYSMIFMIDLPTGLTQIQGLVAALQVVPSDPFPGETVFTDEYKWITSKALQAHPAVDQAEFVIIVKDRFGNVVLDGPGTDQVAVDIAGVAAPNPQVITTFCTDASRNTRTLCQDVDLNGDVRVWHNDDGMYRVKSATTASGTYIVSVALSGFQVKGSPKTVTVGSGAADNERSFVAGEGTVGGAAGDLGFFSVQARDIFGNKLDQNFFVVSNIVDSEGEAKAAATKQTTLSSLDVTYTVTAAGVYTLTVDLNGVAMKGSPFAVTIVPNGIDYRRCIAVGGSLTSAVAGVGGIFTIHARDTHGNQITTGGSDMQMSITGQTLVLGAIQDLNNGSYVGTYQIQIAGSYNLQLLVGTDEFYYGPLQCIAGDLSHEMTSLQVPIKQRIAAGETVSWKAQARDSFGSKILTCGETSVTMIDAELAGTGELYSSNGTNTDIDGNLLCNTGMYEGSFTVTISGEYAFSLMLSGNHILGSPFISTVKPGASSPQGCYAYGNQLAIAGTPASERAVAGKRATFVIQNRDAFGNKVLDDPFAEVSRFNVTLQLTQTTCDTTTGLPLDDNAVCQQAVVKNNGDASFSVEYVPTYAGKFEVVAMLVDKDNKFFLISNSPFTTVVYPASPDTARTVMVNPPLNQTADIFTSFLLQSRDRFDNDITQGGMFFDSFLVRPSDIPGEMEPYKFASTVNDLRNGKYEVIFKVTAAGSYKLEVQVAGSRILNSPIPMDIMPAMINYGECTIDGNGVIGGLTGYEASFTIYARDSFGNQLSVGGANFLARIQTPSDQARGDGSASINPVPVDNGDGTYSVSYQSGETSTPAFKWHILTVVGVNIVGETVVRGGLKDRVLWEPDTLPSTAGRTIAYGAGIRGGTVGVDIKFGVQLCNVNSLYIRNGGMQVTASMESAFDDDPIKVAVSIKDNRDGSFEGTYQANVARTYYLTIRLSGEHVLGSPFTVEIRPGTSSALDSSVRSTNLIGAAGETVTFLVTAKDRFGNDQVYNTLAGPDLFRAELMETSTGRTQSFITQNNEDGTYIIGYTATVSGIYNMKVSLNGQELPTGSLEGLQVLTGDVVTSECRSGGVPRMIAAGTSQTLLIYARDIYSNLVPSGTEVFNASISGSDGLVNIGMLTHCGANECGRGDSSTCPCPDGINLGVYGVPYSLTRSGTYSLSVKRDGFEVPGFPATVSVEPSFTATHKTTVVGCEAQCDPQLVRCTGKDYECNSCSCSMVRVMQAGVKTSFKMQSRDSYGNKVSLGRKTFRATALKKVPAGKTSCLMSEGCTPAFVEGNIIDNLDGTYRVEFTLEVLGEYELSITRSLEHIEGSPFDLTVEPGPASSAVDGSVFELEPVATAGQAKTFTIASRDLFGNVLSRGGEQFVSSLTGTGIRAGTIVPAQTFDNGDGTYLCQFKIILAGKYILQVQHNGNVIAPGAVELNVLPANPRADFCTVKGTGLSPLQPAGSVAVDPYYVAPEITVTARDSYRNIYNFQDLHIEIKGTGAMDFSLNSTDKAVSRYSECGDGCGNYIFKNSLQKSGDYTFSVYLHKKDFFGNIVESSALNAIPVEFRVAGASTSPKHSFFAGAGSEACSVMGTCKFQIQAVDSFGNILNQGGDKFVASLTYIANDATRLKVGADIVPANQSGSGGLSYNEGLYDVSYQATRSGTYVLQVTRYGQSIKGSPKTLAVAAGTVEPSACSASGYGHLGGVYTVGSSLPLSFQLNVVDKFGNSVQDSVLPVLSFAVSPQGSIQPTITTLPKVGGWIYTLNYVPQSAVDHTLTVKINGVNVKGSPFIANIIGSESGAANYVDSSFTTTEGLTNNMVTVGQVSTMIIRPRSKNLQVKAATSNYVVRMLEDGPAPALCKLCTSAPLVLQVGEMRCCWSRGDATNSPSVKILSGVAGIQKVLVGEERLDISIGYAHVAGSPFNLHMMPATVSAPNCTIESQTVRAIGSTVAGFPNSLRLYLRDVLGNQLISSSASSSATNVVITASDSGQEQQFSLNDEKNGALSLAYTITRSGSYEIDIKLGSQPFGKQSPISVVVVPDLMTTKTSTASFTWPYDSSGNFVKATAGIEGNVVVQSRDVYSNRVLTDTASFQVMVTGRVTLLSLPRYNGAGSYSTTSLLTVSSTYAISVYNVDGGCSGPDDCDHVQGSPFTVVVEPAAVDPAQCEVAGPGKRSGAADGITLFQVTMRDAYSNKVSVMPEGAVVTLTASSTARRVHRRSGREEHPIHQYDPDGSVPIEVEGVVKGQDVGGNIIGYYKAPMDGVYKLKVTYNGVVIGATRGAACGETLPCPIIAKANPPSVTKAQFSDSGGHIYVHFDHATDKANQAGMFPCSQVFGAAALATLSESAVVNCVWLTPTIMDVMLEYGATVQVNDDLAWSPGMIGLAPTCLQGNSSVCFKHSKTIEGSVRIARPDDAMSPTAVLKAPRKVGPCDSVTIDASSSTGSGGRQLQYFFGLQPGTPNDAEVRKFVLGQVAPPYSRSVISIPANLLIQGVDYTLVVRATNFLDQSDTAEVTISKSFDDGPIISIEGPASMEVQAAKSFKLRGGADLSVCSDPATTVRPACCIPFKVETGPITYNWTVASITPELPGGITLHAMTRNTRQLYVPSNSLTPGHKYVMQLMGTMSSNSSSVGIATVEIDCIFAPLIAKIAGGNRALYVGEDMLLDATGSIDQDGALSANPFTFRWSCTTENGGQCFDDYMGLFRTTSGRLLVPKNMLLPGIYHFSVVASKEPGPRTATASVEVVMTPVPQYNTEVEALSVVKFNANEQLKLTGMVGSTCDGTASDECSLEWSQIEGDHVLEHPTYLETPIILPSLMFKTGVFMPGAFYRFRLSSSCPSTFGASQAGFATVSVRINSPPGSGQLHVSPLQGVAGSTVFSLSLVNWVDDLEDLPFRYEFRYETEGAPGDLIPLAELDVNYFSSVLTGPTIKGQLSHKVTLQAHVIDQFAGKATVRQNVTVASSVRRDAAAAMKAMDKAISEANAEAIIAIMISLAQDASLKCSEQASFITILQSVGAKIVMSATEIAGFQSALSSVLGAPCVTDGSRRLLGDTAVCGALGMTQGLLGSTMSQGLDPTAEKSSGSTLSSALDTISSKNKQRRKLRSLLGISSGGGDFDTRGRAVFRRGNRETGVRAEAGGCAASQGNMLMGALSGLANSQLNGAVTGQDPKTLNRGSIAMQASQAKASSFVGAELSAGGSAFKTPTDMFTTGGSSSLKARTSNLGSSPFDSDYELGGVSSLTFGVKVSNLKDPIELSMPQTQTSGGVVVSAFVCSANGTANGVSFANKSQCEAGCFSDYVEPNATNVTVADKWPNRTATPTPRGSPGNCSSKSGNTCGQDMWTPCVNGEIDTCMFWNGKTWDGEGCIVHQIDPASKKLVCHCYHLTDFGGTVNDVLPKMNVVDPTNPAAVFANLSADKILVICIVVGMLVGYWCLLYWGWRQDQIDNAKFEEDPGKLSKKMTRRAYAKEDANMLLDANNMAILNKQMKGQFSRNLMMIKDKAMQVVKSQHKLFSAFFASRHTFTRPRRFTVLFCMIIGNMVCNAVLAGAEGTSFIQKIIGGVLSSLMMLLPTFFFKKVFMSMGVDPRTRARWEKQDELMFRARRTQMALTVTQGPTVNGVAAPPQDLKKAVRLPGRTKRGYVPAPEQERMIVPGDLQQAPPAYKRKANAGRPAMGPAGGRPTPLSSAAASGRSVRISGGNFGNAKAPAPPTSPPPVFSSAAVGGPPVGADGEVEGATPMFDVGGFIPRRALPLSAGARPPAPVVTPDPAESQDTAAGAARDAPSSVKSHSTDSPRQPGQERLGTAGTHRSIAASQSASQTGSQAINQAANRAPPPIPEEYQRSIDDDDDGFGGEKSEALQGMSLNKEKKELGRIAKYKAKVATAFVRNLSKPKRDVSEVRAARLIDHRFQYLAYLMATIWYLTACYFAILYGVAFSTEIEQAWLIAFFVSVLQDLFINETLIISVSTSVKYIFVPNAAGWMATRIVSKYQ